MKYINEKQEEIAKKTLEMIQGFNDGLSTIYRDTPLRKIIEDKILYAEVFNLMVYIAVSIGPIDSIEAEMICTALGTDYIKPSVLEDYKIDFLPPIFEKIPPMLPYYLAATMPRENADVDGYFDSISKLFYYAGGLIQFVHPDKRDVVNKISEEYSQLILNFDIQKLTEMGTDLMNQYGDDESSLVFFNEYINLINEYNGTLFADEAENTSSSCDSETNVDDLLSELNALVGLNAVKKDVNQLVHMKEIESLRIKNGLSGTDLSNHLVFYGNPGTGKTTVARLLADIYHKIGVLSKGHLVEVDRSGLVAGYVGQTAIKTQEVINKAMGGVLFIDEAYTLAQDKSSNNDYGQEAIDTLLKAMEDNRNDLIVIVAGYTEPMKDFINSNPGLQSRFNKYLYFEDYTVEELGKIFSIMCEKGGYTYNNDVLEAVKSKFDNRIKQHDRYFANAREVRNLFEKAILNQADRLYGNKNITKEMLKGLDITDVQNIEL
ncbi:AAA family ATPase [Butyrivibrio sp. NC3005]|uniref:AAA family ATPase n=1 Tax=Butyrivibrio sp. NC3005 TaxID=1280685 RepID=UPI0004127A28|nr:AAA family ATPase [Butyrivibrio sp. NC3005]